MNLDTLNRDELFKEICELAREEGVLSKDMWDELVGETIDAHFDLGELNDDQDLEGTKTAIKEMWEEYQNMSGPETMDAISEDPEAPRG